jgi:tetratricopeptide (TPR) repeat protein
LSTRKNKSKRQNSAAAAAHRRRQKPKTNPPPNREAAQLKNARGWAGTAARWIVGTAAGALLVTVLLNVPPYSWLDGAASKDQVNELHRDTERAQGILRPDEELPDDYRDALRRQLKGGLAELVQKAAGEVAENRLEDARATLEYASALAITPQEKVSTALDLGVVYEGLGRIADSIEQHDYALSQARSMTDKVAAARTLGSVAIHKKSIGQWETARQLYSDAIVIFRTYGEAEDEAKTEHNIAMLAMDMGDSELALARIEAAYTINTRLGRAEGQVKNLVIKGYFLRALDRKPEALENYLTAMSLSLESQNAFGYMSAASAVSGIQRELEDYEGSITTARVLLDYAERNRLVLIQIDALGLLGLASLQSGQLDDAYEYHSRAEALAAANKLREQQSIALFELGDVRLRQNNLDDAQLTYERSRQIASDLNNRFVQVEANMGLAYVSFRRENYREAFGYACAASGLEPMVTMQVLKISTFMALVAMPGLSCSKGSVITK